MAGPDQDIVSWGREAVLMEAAALAALADSLGESFSSAVSELLRCNGRLVVMGMGKSGHVARKIASTFASTGMPAIFVHPAEASHGDLGMIEKRDIVIVISKSGESPEFGDVLAYCRRFSITTIAITANSSSSMAALTDHILLLPNIPEACPLGLAPTSSTTMSLALGDALAVACLQSRDFQPSQFHDFHPGGKLGQKLMRVRDVMHVEGQLPLVPISADLTDAVFEMGRGRLGCVGILNQDGRLAGVFTDGDLRRHITNERMTRKIDELMHRSPQTISPDAMVEDAASMFAEKRIPSVFVCVEGVPVGIVHIHDLFQKGFV